MRAELKVIDFFIKLLYIALLLISIQGFKEKNWKKGIIAAAVFLILAALPFALLLGVGVSMV